MSDFKRTTCPFCLNGCESGVNFNYQYRMEYVMDGKVNQGRLCPRGNSASIVIDHPRRLAYPLLDGKEITWEQAFGKVKEWLARVRPEEIAVVFSRGLTEQEVRLVGGLAQALGTTNLVCGYIEPDNCFGQELAGVAAAALDDFLTAKTMLIAGDVFSKSPVAAKPIVDARYRDRTSRIVVIDSIKTKLAGFAHLFIWVRPGTEPWALAAIAALLDRSLKGIDVDGFARLCGVERAQLQEAAKIVSGTDAGIVISAMCLGRASAPVLHNLCSQLVALKAGKPFVGFGEARIPEGPMPFGKFMEAVAAGHIKTVLWFGSLYPYSYPEIFPEMKNVTNRVATSIFRPEETLPGLILPVPSELEKDSVGRSVWGEVVRHALARPVSGSRFVHQIVAELGVGAEAAIDRNPPVSVQEVVTMLAAAASGLVQTNGEDGFLLLGEKRAFGIGGFYDAEQELSINPTDAINLGVSDGNRVVVKSDTNEREFSAKVTGAFPAGAMGVGVNVHANRALFPLVVERATGRVTVPPARVRVWRKG